MKIAQNYFQIHYVQDLKMYDFTVFDKDTHKVIYHYHFSNLQEINKLIHKFKLA